MLYSRKTGRLAFEAVDVMIVNGPRVPSKRSRIAVAETKIKRPETKAKTDVNLERRLSKYKMEFSRRSGDTLVHRIMGIRETLGIARRAALYATACVVTGLLLYGTIAATDIHFAREVIVGGRQVGIVKSAQEFEALTQSLRESLSVTLGKEIESTPEPVYIARLVFGKDITPQYQLRQNILATFDEVEEAYAIYVNDTLLCAALTEQAANNALNRVKEAYREEAPDARIEFVDAISVRKEFIPVGYMRSEEGVYMALTATREGATTYTVTERDTLWEIANKFEMTVDDLYAVNAGLSEMIHAGDEVNITKSVPLLSVRTAYTYEGERAIPFETQEVPDANLPAGNRKVEVEGAVGAKYVVEEVVKINGEPVETVVKSETVLAEPVAAKVRVGTKKSLSTVASSGKLARPVYGTISSRFGQRGRGFHSGLDIAAPTGTPIYAADGGTVTFAAWEGAYGYLMKVDHGGGYVTYYGHCSSFVAKAGDKVNKGDVIAKVGNTGRSTGPHVHFEVRVNGTPQNPSNYVN